MGFLLYIIASLLKLIMTPISYSYCSIRSLSKREFNEYNLNLALAKDQYGNALSKYLFNDLLIKKDGYKFGNIDETISSCLGKNKLNRTLTIFGKGLDNILDFLDSNHSIKSVDNNNQLIKNGSSNNTF